MISFDDLRRANIARLPRFKNAKGKRAHSKDDGSDWSPAQWLQAVIGELGEYANLRKKLERGDFDDKDNAEIGFVIMPKIAKELADVMIYLDILAFRNGVDLGKAVRDKFNEVSDRVGVDIKIGEDGFLVVDGKHELDSIEPNPSDSETSISSGTKD